MKSIALLGEFTPTFKPHLATNAAIEHSSAALGIAFKGVHDYHRASAKVSSRCGIGGVRTATDKKRGIRLGKS